MNHILFSFSLSPSLTPSLSLLSLSLPYLPLPHIIPISLFIRKQRDMANYIPTKNIPLHHHMRNTSTTIKELWPEPQ